MEGYVELLLWGGGAVQVLCVGPRHLAARTAGARKRALRRVVSVAGRVGDGHHWTPSLHGGTIFPLRTIAHRLVVVMKLAPVRGGLVLKGVGQLEAVYTGLRRDVVQPQPRGDAGAEHGAGSGPVGGPRVPGHRLRPLVVRHSLLLALITLVVVTLPLERVRDLRWRGGVGGGGRVAGGGGPGVGDRRSKVLRFASPEGREVGLGVERPVLHHVVPHGPLQFEAVVLELANLTQDVHHKLLVLLFHTI